MHPHLIDWLRKIHLNADVTLAEKRWKTAENIVESLTRQQVIDVLRIFLFSSSSKQMGPSFTNVVLAADKEFPATNNHEDLRLLAGVIMVVCFEQRSIEGDAFALGIQAASFPLERVSPAQPAIIYEAAKYAQEEANRLRPSRFSKRSDCEAMTTKFEELVAAIDAADEDGLETAREATTTILNDQFASPLRRLAEETGLLWWLMGGYSPILNLDRSGLAPESYCLIAAAEAADRVKLLPPPLSVQAIIRRAMGGCKEGKVKKLTMRGIVDAADPEWRSQFVASKPGSDCLDLVPFTTALVRTEENGDSASLSKALPKSCPGVNADAAVSASAGAEQMFSELVFLNALNALE